jgi:ATP synthase subunit 6
MKHKLDIFDIFVPSGVNMFLEIILIPIEIISYIFRPISLSIRLFANIMAGHTLLKVICNFIVKFFKLDIFLVFNFFPFLLLVILFGLELFVALIQSYVFFILICLFLKDIINLDH